MLEALGRLNAASPPPPHAQSQPHARQERNVADDRVAWEGAGVVLWLAGFGIRQVPGCVMRVKAGLYLK